MPKVDFDGPFKLPLRNRVEIVLALVLASWLLLLIFIALL